MADVHAGAAGVRAGMPPDSAVSAVGPPVAPVTEHSIVSFFALRRIPGSGAGASAEGSDAGAAALAASDGPAAATAGASVSSTSAETHVAAVTGPGARDPAPAPAAVATPAPATATAPAPAPTPVVPLASLGGPVPAPVTAAEPSAGVVESTGPSPAAAAEEAALVDAAGHVPVEFSVGGRVFAVLPVSLRVRGEGSLLDVVLSGSKSWDAYDAGGRPFFDRDPYAFEPVLGFLRAGRVHIRSGIPREAVVEEADFFGVTLPPWDDKHVVVRRLRTVTLFARAEHQIQPMIPMTPMPMSNMSLILVR